MNRIHAIAGAFAGALLVCSSAHADGRKPRAAAHARVPVHSAVQVHKPKPVHTSPPAHTPVKTPQCKPVRPHPQHCHNPHMHHALHELRDARADLKGAAHDFGGHRAKAMAAIDLAMQQIHLAFKHGHGEIRRPSAFVADHHAHPCYSRYPHLYHALHELRETRMQLREASHDFGGHRAAALRDVDYAINQLELAIKYANPR